MSYSKTIRRVVFEILLVSSVNIVEVIDGCWIRSQTLTTNYHLTFSTRAGTTTHTPSTQQASSTQQIPSTHKTAPTQQAETIVPIIPEGATVEEIIAANARHGFKLIDGQYATMRPSSKWPDFSRIRDDAIFLQHFSNERQAPDKNESLLFEVYDYFDKWPTVPVEKWKDRVPPDEMFRYLEYAEKHVSTPPHLVLRWIILVTWLLKSKEWNDTSKVPEPMLTRFKIMEEEFRRINVNEKLPIVEIGRGNVEAFRNGFFL